MPKEKKLPPLLSLGGVVSLLLDYRRTWLTAALLLVFEAVLNLAIVHKVPCTSAEMEHRQREERNWPTTSFSSPFASFARVLCFCVAWMHAR